MNLTKMPAFSPQTPGPYWFPTLSPYQGCKAVIVCTNGHQSSVGTAHEIAPDGRVTPSFVCSQNCGFHEHVVLEGWGPATT